MAKKYVDVEKLKVEIKRLEEMDYHCDTFEQSVGFYEALDYIKSFLNSLQQEQPEIDFEKEINKTVSECTNGYNFDWDRFARHFYELGLKAKEE